jgi:glycerol uptake facilitator-like aquaporin
MEKRHGNENKASIFIVEFLGTAVLSLTASIYWTANNLFVNGATDERFLNLNSWYLFMGMGCCLYTIYFLFSHISGGHFNPAVSIAVYISIAFNTNNIVMLLLILVAQFTGAFGGMVLSRGLRTYSVPVTGTPTFPYATNFNSLTYKFVQANGASKVEQGEL